MTAHSLSGQLDPVFGCPHSKKFLCAFRWNFLFMPIASFSVTWHHWEESFSIFFTPCHQIFVNCDKIFDKITPRLLFSRLNNPCSFSLLSGFSCFIKFLWAFRTYFSKPMYFTCWERLPSTRKDNEKWRLHSLSGQPGLCYCPHSDVFPPSIQSECHFL